MVGARLQLFWGSGVGQFSVHDAFSADSQGHDDARSEVLHMVQW